jgi:hypothetical protein
MPNLTPSWQRFGFRLNDDVASVPLERWRKFTANGGGADGAVFGANTTEFNTGTQQPFFRKDAFGNVAFRGAIKTSGAAWLANEILFTLPAGYRPIGTQRQMVPSNASSYQVLLITGATGVVTLDNPSGTAPNTLANAGARTHLDQISFRAEQ